MTHEPKEFPTVGDLIKHLLDLGPNRPLIVDIDGCTFQACEDDIAIWNPNDVESPVAIYFHALGDIND